MKLLKDLKTKFCQFQRKNCETKDDGIVSDERCESKVNEPPKPVPVSELLAEADRRKREQADRQAAVKAEVDHDELHNFSYKIVKDEQNASRSSKDSGFADEAEKADEASPKEDVDEEEEANELVETLHALDLNEDKKKTKVCQVAVARGKGLHKTFMPPPSAPYQTFSNRQILSGGQVTVNQPENGHADISLALSNVERSVRRQAHDARDEMLALAEEVIHDDLKGTPRDLDFDADLMHLISSAAGDMPTPYFELPVFDSEVNPVEEFHLQQGPPYSEFDTSLTETLLDLRPDSLLTPPRSNENVFDPDSPFNPSGSVYSIQSPMSDDLISPPEQAGDVAELVDLVFPDLPESVLESERDSGAARKRQPSTASLNLKQFKELQNQLSAAFAKDECCRREAPPPRDALRASFDRLDAGLRADLCLRLSALPLHTCYGVLQHILMGLSSESEQEDLLYSVFSLICERVLGQRPALFLEDFGLNLLKAAALRCPARPLLTRYLVQCVRLALDAAPAHRPLPNQPLFKETDKRGDTLVGACARRGDECADSLAELLRRTPPADAQPPLFDVAHCNAEGMSALHVACGVHGTTRALRTVHVLLEHGGADVWQGDIKGGDTALHYAVKPGVCDLDLVMTLFKQVDRKKWKQLAHVPNRSLVSPIETARAATRSSRHSYPEEVLSFLKKCRT